MQARTSTSLAALLLGVALVATPAFAADSVAGKQGAPATNRDAPVALPGKLTPKPVPKVDASSLSRGPLGLDPAAAAESMATITHSADGTDTETPASGELRDILNQAIQGSTKQEMSTDRVVTGTDDRTQITDTTKYPAYAVGWLAGACGPPDHPPLGAAGGGCEPLDDAASAASAPVRKHRRAMRPIAAEVTTARSQRSDGVAVAGAGR